MKSFVVMLLGCFFCAPDSAAVAQAAVPQVSNAETLFIGDSITAYWADMPIHVGAPGFQACVIRLLLSSAMTQHPGIKRVVIEAGTNDILLGPGPGTDCELPNQDPVSSVVDMVKTVRTAGMQAFVLSVLPIARNNLAGQPCGPLVSPFNTSLQSAVTAAGAVWIDGYDAFNGHPEYQNGPVHPNEAGYHVLESVYAATACAAAGCSAIPTQTTLSSNATTVIRPANVTLVATVTPSGSTGVVNFYYTDNAGFIVSVPLDKSGTAIATIPTANYVPGSYQIFAGYVGDAGHLLSFSSIVDGTLQ